MNIMEEIREIELEELFEDVLFISQNESESGLLDNNNVDEMLREFKSIFEFYRYNYRRELNYNTWKSIIFNPMRDKGDYYEIELLNNKNRESKYKYVNYRDGRKPPVFLKKIVSKSMFDDLQNENCLYIEENIKNWMNERDLLYPSNKHLEILNKIREWIKKNSSDYLMTYASEEETDYEDTEDEHL